MVRFNRWYVHILQVTANDPDTDTNGLVTYSLEPLADGAQLDISQVFSIDGDSGWITTLREVDCERSRMFRFNVVATDHGGEVKLSSSVRVEVMVTDENDNPPTFSEEVYRGSVVENITPFEPIVSMTTFDADVALQNRLVTCYITGVCAHVRSDAFSFFFSQSLSVQQE